MVEFQKIFTQALFRKVRAYELKFFARRWILIPRTISSVTSLVSLPTRVHERFYPIRHGFFNFIQINSELNFQML